MANSVFLGWIAGIPVNGGGGTVTFNGNVAATGQFLSADGTVAAPGYSWSSQSTFGEFRSASNRQTLAAGTSATRQDFANTYTSATNHELFSVDWQTQANAAIVGTRTAATGTQRVLRLVAQGDSASVNATTLSIDRNSAPFFRFGIAGIASGAFDQSASAAGNWMQLASITSTAPFGSVVPVAITPAYNQTGGSTAANTDLLINRTETAVGSGTQLLIDAQVGGASRFNVDRTGAMATYGYRSGSRAAYGGVQTALGAVTLSGATSATSNIVPAGAIVVGIATTVTTAITGATGYQVGDGSDADRYGDITGTAVGTNSDNTDATADPSGYNAAASAITLTAKTSNFTGGVVQVVVFYLTTGAS